ncbi:glycoside hydrolase family 65 protein [Actinotalea sp. K2]|uniref:glycoside hydrolase family 65 protein n=1 Tax=Actinotalea sp. K2 TaxID=2939438 RepID=UPI002016ADF9|nr:glycosyl hydrolase family 65 protein [Actinotalea sp. K2]MCL3863182.1 glycoside hydrolase family 65 protein [Actinotalea sp. K2]
MTGEAPSPSVGTLGDLPDHVDRNRFPADPWRLTEAFFDEEDLGTTETLFAVGNGYLGMRGNLTEGRPSHSHGTFINGFHETWPIRHAEEAFGFAQVGQTIVNVPDAKIMRLYVDDEPMLLSVADLISYDRTLDFADGVLTRDLLWRTPAGNRVHVRSRRMVSFTQRHLAVLTLEVTVLDNPVPVVVSSQILNRQDGLDEFRSRTAAGGMVDPRRGEQFEQRVLQPMTHWGDDDRVVLGYRCTNSRMALAVAADHTVETDNDYETLTEVESDQAKHVFRFRAKPGKKIRITKTISYHTSRNVPAVELVNRCRRTLDRVREEGTDKQFADQRAWLDAYWERSDVEVEGHPEVQQAIRWNLFQLAQAAARAEGNGISAKGVTGSGYSGHYFWDTEIYVVPYFIYTSPLFARNAVRFRYTMLPAAKRRAQELTQHGVLFPWRTINGEEASAYYAAGTAQYHIDADVSYAVSKYVQATGDEEFMAREGVDILVQTARMWADLGFWRGNGEDSFHIHGVTGPDEYTTVVNDNLYTNVMARFNLRRAAEAVRHLEASWPQEHARMVARLDLRGGEVAEWDRAAEAMAIPFDANLGIHPQDSHFHEREVWDLPSTPADKRPLLLHYHPLVIYRFQVLKQADVVLALFLQGEHFSAEEKRADFEYYDPITTGDSTLSGVVQSIVAAEVGYHELALRYFHDALFVDLGDLHHNTSDGVHVASAGGVWSALVHGFGGMRDYEGKVSFDPRLPVSWPSLTFRLTVRGTRVRVQVRAEAIELTVETGPALVVSVRGQDVMLSRAEPVTVPLDGQGPQISGEPDATALRGTLRADGTVITASVPHHSGLNR